MINVITFLSMALQAASAFNMCNAVVSQETIDSTYADRIGVCIAVVNEARIQRVDETIVVALGWSESRFDPKRISSIGAFGPLQVTKFWCKKGEDPIAAGVTALKTLEKMKGSMDLALCHYACGNVCYTSGRKYAKYIRASAKRLMKQR